MSIEIARSQIQSPKVPKLFVEGPSCFTTIEYTHPFLGDPQGGSCVMMDCRMKNSENYLFSGAKDQQGNKQDLP